MGATAVFKRETGLGFAAVATAVFKVTSASSSMYEAAGKRPWLTNAWRRFGGEQEAARRGLFNALRGTPINVEPVS